MVGALDLIAEELGSSHGVLMGPLGKVEAPLSTLGNQEEEGPRKLQPWSLKI